MAGRLPSGMFGQEDAGDARRTPTFPPQTDADANTNTNTNTNKLSMELSGLTSEDKIIGFGVNSQQILEQPKMGTL